MSKKLNHQEIIDRLAGVKLLSLDVDGVLTDGGLYYTDEGRVSRKFNTKDGLGMQRVMKAGVKIAIISAGSTASILHRGKGLGVDYVFNGVDNKLVTLQKIATEMGIELSDVAHVGDDLNDMPILEAIGCPLSVADAMHTPKEMALYVTERKGGDGAVREICDLIMASK